MWLEVDPGDYILMCWNNEHAVHPFTVRETGEADETPPKAADVVLKMVDFKFQLEGHLREGTHVVRIDTPGPSMHEVDFFRLHDGKTMDDIKRWRKLKMRNAALLPGRPWGERKSSCRRRLLKVLADRLLVRFRGWRDRRLQGWIPGAGGFLRARGPGS
jgi:hypothetical protein